MKTITATAARSNLFKLLKNTSNTHTPVRVSFKGGSTIIISEEDYENMLETAELLSIPGLKTSINKADSEIKKGEVLSYEEVFKK